MNQECLVRLAACLLLSSLLMPGAFALDVTQVGVTTAKFLDDGQPDGYGFGVNIIGFDLAGGRLVHPGAPVDEICTFEFVQSLPDGRSEWDCVLFGFGTLNQICQAVGFGNFEIEFTASVGSDDILPFVYNPGCTDPFSGHAMFTLPVSGGSVPPVSNYCWACSAPGTCGPDAFVAIDDPTNGIFVASEVIRNVPDPFCWNPGTCFPLAAENELAVASTLYYADVEPISTNLNDPLDYTATFEAQNFILFSVSGRPPSTPPAVPAGEGGSTAMLATKLNASATSIEVNWDATSCCGVNNHHLVWGSGSDLPASPGGTYSLDGSLCTAGASGVLTWNSVPTPPPGDFIWWVMLANDGSTTEGSWGVNSLGQTRSGTGAGGVSGQCGMTTRDLTNTCGN